MPAEELSAKSASLTLGATHWVNASFGEIAKAEVGGDYDCSDLRSFKSTRCTLWGGITHHIRHHTGQREFRLCLPWHHHQLPPCQANHTRCSLVNGDRRRNASKDTVCGRRITESMPQCTPVSRTRRDSINDIVHHFIVLPLLRVHAFQAKVVATPNGIATAKAQSIQQLSGTTGQVSVNIFLLQLFNLLAAASRT